MKKKVGTVTDEGTVRLAKRHAAEKGVPLNDAGKETGKRLKAFSRFCGSPMKLSSGQFKAVLNASPWG